MKVRTSDIKNTSQFKLNIQIILQGAGFHYNLISPE